MAGNTLINGTGYKISGGGRVLVNGVSYQVQKGRTLIAGTGYDIAFQKTLGTMPVGTEVRMHYRGLGNTIQGILVHKGNPNPSIYDASCNGAWIWLNHSGIVAEHGRDNHNYPFSYSNSDYPNSDAFDICESKAKERINTAFSYAIKSVKLPYYNTSQGKVMTLGNGVSCQVFLLSLVEFGFSATDDIPQEGCTLDYFKNSSVDKTGKEIIEGSSWESGRYLHATRSVSMLDGGYCYYINSNNAYDRVLKREERAYRWYPAFILPYDVKLNDNNYIIT